MRKGFTLIEVIIVVAILGIISASALPRFVDLQHKTRENTSKAILGNIRATIAIHYASNAAWGAATLVPSTVEANMFQDGMVPKEPFSQNAAVEVGAGTPTGTTGGWYYDSVNGRAYINHTDYSDY